MCQNSSCVCILYCLLGDKFVEEAVILHVEPDSFSSTRPRGEGLPIQHEPRAQISNLASVCSLKCSQEFMYIKIFLDAG